MDCSSKGGDKPGIKISWERSKTFVDASDVTKWKWVKPKYIITYDAKTGKWGRKRLLW
ncbi:MAG: hypothetical protein WC455_13470 [Dehalococcoidia bacterium]|jgi:hypothetical protein